jgi:predicted nucleotidyltransferase
MSKQEEIVGIILTHYPEVQAIYLFGSYDTKDEWPDSDVDVALLLPPSQSKKTGPMMLSACQRRLEEYIGKKVDLVNIRQVSTVFQNEIISDGRLLYLSDRYAMEEFEMLTLSYYQKLNEERRGLLEAFRQTGRAYKV